MKSEPVDLAPHLLAPKMSASSSRRLVLGLGAPARLRAGVKPACWTAPVRGIRVYSDGLWNESLEALLPPVRSFEPEPAFIVPDSVAAVVESENAMLLESYLADAPMFRADAGEFVEEARMFGRTGNRNLHHHPRHATVDNPANLTPGLPNGEVGVSNEKTPRTGQMSSRLWPKWGGTYGNKRGFASAAMAGGGGGAGGGKDFTRATFYTPNVEDASRRLPTQRDQDAKVASAAAAPAGQGPARVTPFDAAESTGHEMAADVGEGLKKAGQQVKGTAQAVKEKTKAGLSNLEEKASAAADSAYVGGAASKAASAAGSVRQEMEKPASQVAEDAARVIGTAAGRTVAAASTAAIIADAPLGGDEDIGASLSETLEVRSDYPMETGITPPSYLKGGRDEGRDPDELVTELEEGAGLYEETGVSAPSSIGIQAPLKGPGVEGTNTRDLRKD